MRGGSQTGAKVSAARPRAVRLSCHCSNLALQVRLRSFESFQLQCTEGPAVPLFYQGLPDEQYPDASDAISVLFCLIPQASHVFSNRTSPRGFGVQIAICVCLQLGRRFASEISAILQIQFHASVHWWASCGLFLKNISYCLLLITCY